MTSTVKNADSSIRTPDRPMDFTGDEFMNGALWTWGLFNAVIPMGVLASMLWSLSTSSGWSWTSAGPQTIGYAIIVCGIVVVVSLVLVPLGLALTWPFARLLRRVRPVPVHLLAYTLIGAGIGVLYLAAVGGLSTFGTVNTYTILVATPAVAITIATPLGWWLSARRALRKDRGLLSAGVDEDAAVEDAAAQ